MRLILTLVFLSGCIKEADHCSNQPNEYVSDFSGFRFFADDDFRKNEWCWYQLDIETDITINTFLKFYPFASESDVIEKIKGQSGQVRVLFLNTLYADNVYGTAGGGMLNPEIDLRTKNISAVYNLSMSHELIHVIARFYMDAIPDHEHSGHSGEHLFIQHYTTEADRMNTVEYQAGSKICDILGADNEECFIEEL